MNVRYVTPADIKGVRAGVEFVTLQNTRSGMQFFFTFPAIVRQLLWQRADLYHFQDPELIPVALALKIIFHKHVVYDAYEDFPSMALQKRSFPVFLRPLVAKTVAAMEGLATHCLDGVITADPLTLRRLAHTGKSRKLVFFNFPNLDLFPPPKVKTKKFDVVYRGGLSARAGTLILLEAMRLLADRGRTVRLLLIGYFDDAVFETELHKRIGSFGLSGNVELRGRIDHEDMAQALSEATIGVCPLQDIPKFRLNIPVKIFEYWACGLPVVASDMPPIRPFFRNTGAGFLYRPYDASELARSVGWLLNNPDAAKRMGQNGRSAIVQRFNNQNEIHKLSEFCVRISGTP
ncbi:MAG TPA: glycosyltransferase family 4 protein [Candidatus Acidoferrales bacterium]|nr:glycosyltransferase family 4 protein [Candidatus Acidoferrales bacterium]